eukprot:scaffold343_cov266-Chaetoceros_neogracile.AAC.13
MKSLSARSLILLLYTLSLCFIDAFVASSRSQLSLAKQQQHDVPDITTRIDLLKRLQSRYTHSMISSASASSGETEHEEILMKIVFSVKNGKSHEEAINVLQSYIASFPFSAVLPVQPLTYIPRDDGNGVNVSFLRKKTTEKGSIDGGINFILSSVQDDTEEVVLVAMRNAEGQTVSKVFTEGLVIKSFTAGLYGDEEGKTGLRKDELMDTISIEKCIHKWM